MSSYVAKFRVLSRTEESNMRQGADHVWRPTPAFVLSLRPVNPRHNWNAPSDDVCEENAKFFEASPSGEFSMLLFPEEAAAFPVGQAVLVHFEPREDGAWTLGALHVEQGGNVRLQLHRRGAQGSFQIGVQLVPTIEKLLEDVSAQAHAILARRRTEAGGKGVVAGPEMNWSLTITPTEG